MAPYAPRPSRSFRKILPRLLQYLVLCLGTLVILVPIVILCFGSLKTTGEMFVSPYTIPIPRPLGELRADPDGAHLLALYAQ